MGWGYCACIKDGEPLHVDSFIPAEGNVTADQFVEWVFLAENLEPSLRPKSHGRGLRDAFIKLWGRQPCRRCWMTSRCAPNALAIKFEVFSGNATYFGTAEFKGRSKSSRASERPHGQANSMTAPTGRADGAGEG